MKISLICQYSYSLSSYGVRILSSFLKNKGIQTQIIFMHMRKSSYSENEINQLVDVLQDSDFVGVSLMSNFLPNAIQMTSAIKERLNKPTIWGGIHPTAMPEDCLKYVDYVCVGEGEEALYEFITNFNALSNVSNLCFKKNGEIVRNKVANPISNLDVLPFPDYDVGQHFILAKGKLKKLTKETFERRLLETYPTFHTRGCLLNCSYCCNNILRRLYPKIRLFRSRSVDNVISEVVKAKNSFPSIKYINFHDDCFMAMPIQKMEEFCNKYKKLVKLPFFIAGAIPFNIDKHKMRILTDAGLVSIHIGIQTGSSNTQKTYNRKISNEKLLEVTAICNSLKDKLRYINYQVILDNPYENEGDVLETLKLFTQIPPPYILWPFSLRFYPGTDLFRQAVKDKIIDADPCKNQLEHITKIRPSNIRDRLLAANTPLTQASRADRHISYATQFTHREDKWNISGEYRHEKRESPLGKTGGDETDILAGRFGVSLSEKVDLFIRQQLTLKD